LEKKTPLEKRISRHVTGRPQSFFIAVTPGLEDICLDEVKSLLPEIVLSPEKGGIEFEARLHDCYFLNLHLRTANRVLMRIAGFKASNFDTLEKKLSSIEWELYLPRGTSIEISTSTKHSRLYHKDAIDERIKASIINRESLVEFHERTGPSPSFAQQIFVRVVDDRFTISLDSSGELLYKRGLKEQHNARAPMRETIAAAALMMAGYKGDEPLLDPMSGSGTFAIEASMMSTHTPPGLFRDFAFMNWPCFSSARWQHMKKESQKNIIKLKPFSIIASEKNPQLYSELKERTEKFEPSKVITVINMDFFEMRRKDLPVMFNSSHPGIVIINPPYGIRLGTKKAGRELFRNIIKKLESDFKGWRFALFVHDRDLIREIPFKKTSITLDHGGLKLALLTGMI
jgi:putative N6-adenine-specific DNA methylase